MDSSSICMCGGWKMFHDMEKKSKEKIQGSCGNYTPYCKGYEVCIVCNKFIRTVY